MIPMLSKLLPRGRLRCSTKSTADPLLRGSGAEPTTKHDFDNQLETGIFEGVDPSDAPAELLTR